MTRRGVIRLLGLGAGVALVRPAVAREGRFRVLVEPEAAGRGPGGQASPEFRRFLADVRVGEARAHGALRVFWLHAAPPAAPLAVATLDEARARGDLLVSERDQPTVAAVVVDNRGGAHVLLLAGEIVLGGKQDRVVAEDVLLPPRSGPRKIAVYCVEQGRWVERTKQFQARGSFAAPGLRARVMERAPQARVWAEVDRYASRAAAPSATASHQAVHDSAEVQAHQQEVQRTIGQRPPTAALGAAVFAAETLSGLDLFHAPDLFGRQWPKLLRAHAVETYGRAAAAPDEPGLRARVKELLLKAAGAEGGMRGNAGAGTLFEFRLDRLRGSALVAEGQVIHAAVL